ncbi:MAG: hypothetical protein Q8O26_02875 [Phreatobacter sp.]|uniref:hypothetical protein n=1 Tax=Phreatobacter sp. TaxID=1966341 RepID=UPI0027346853|nr:hypothetical protein [Phreatobacter sp.]MDP2800804.1 hypothetical protein [Phreatobacter sp.]
MTPAEAALYAAEHARPGAAFELALAAGEALALSGHGHLHLNDDEEAVSVAPAPEGRLYANLRQIKHGADMAPLQVKLPPDVALIVLRPDMPATRFAILQDGTKRIAFRCEGVAPARMKPSPQINALSFLASNHRTVTT